MSKRDKLLEKAKRNPDGLRFAELETLMQQSGWTLDRQKGSHRIWKSPKGARLPVQEAKGGKAKGYQVKQFLSIREEEIK
jgi:predicted RNA binding protein YcfA (HicA-like mRNA interferase family)